MGHGWEGVVLKLFRGKDFVFTVTGAEQVVTDRYRRIDFTDGGMLAQTGAHPTMWVRLWFTNAGKPHQRAYTLVDPDLEAGTFSIEFALHEGLASDWARQVQPGESIDATLQGTGFAVPEPLPSRLLVVGDAASLPAINSLLDSMPGVPTTIWFETAHDDDQQLPMRRDPALHDVRYVERRGDALEQQIRKGLPEYVTDPGAFVWIACDTVTTRTLTTYVGKELGVPKQRVKSLGYWRES
ncbi:siderophore-interacting protein [Kribbella deserti]|uniref:Siderophore-interacting protein n=1 Tax=Kribbella deserti TaxID=1926257 RepID=A0ABV6QQC4_9ACTN